MVLFQIHETDNMMNRRLFLKRTCGGVLLLAASPSLISCDQQQRPVRFGVVTDLHYSRREPYGTRYFPQTMEKLKEAIKVFNNSNLDFVIELGDLKDQDNVPQREQTITYLDEIEKEFQTFRGPVYHVLGNHDMDSISKEDFLQHTSNHGDADKKTYYSFTCNNIKFIVLDADIGLQRVGHDVHPRIRRDRGWDTLDQDLIQDRFVRDQVVGRQGVFDVLLRVGNDGKAGDLAAGAAGRRDGDEAGGECRIHIPGKFPHRLG